MIHQEYDNSYLYTISRTSWRTHYLSEDSSVKRKLLCGAKTTLRHNRVQHMKDKVMFPALCDFIFSVQLRTVEQIEIAAKAMDKFNELIPEHGNELTLNQLMDEINQRIITGYLLEPGNVGICMNALRNFNAFSLPNMQYSDNYFHEAPRPVLIGNMYLNFKEAEQVEFQYNFDQLKELMKANL